MNTKLILVEGIPGSGKTTSAKMINEFLTTIGITNELFLEGDVNHPADYESTACLQESQYENLLEKYSDIEQHIRYHTTRQDSHYILPYGKLSIEVAGIPESFYQEIGAYDVYNLPLETYSELILKRWEQFMEKALNENKVYIFECAFLQNPITTFLARNDRTFSDIQEFLMKLGEIVSVLNPLLIYISQDNIEETINRVRRERSKEWFDFVTWYYTQQEFGKSRGLEGFDGVITFLATRKEYEIKLLDALPVRGIQIDNSSYNWENMHQEIKSLLELNK